MGSSDNLNVQWQDVEDIQPVQKTPDQNYGQLSGEPPSLFDLTNKASNASITSTKMLDASSAWKYDWAKTGMLDFVSETKNLSAFRLDPNKDYTSKSSGTDFAIKSEKDRIAYQKKSREYGRPDFFAIGTVYLNIPPTQISVSEERHNFRYKTLRGAADSVTMSGRSTVRIDLDIVFNGLEDINNKLRPLIAQFKCTPFLPIDSDYLKTVISPETGGIIQDVDKGKILLSELSRAQKESSGIMDAYSGSTESVSNLLGEIESMKSRGILSPESARQASTVFSGWYGNRNAGAVLNDSDARNRLSYSGKVDGSYTFDAKGFMQDIIKKNIPSGQSITAIDASVSNIGKLADTFTKYQEQINKSFDLSVDVRYYEKQIVGVLSQMSISTMPGYPQTLSCRISLHVFNYDPYTHDFGFVKGYDPARYTPDICDCDLFVDWYSRRFLGEETSGGNLGKYTLDDSMMFQYTTEISYNEMIAGSAPNIQVGKITIGNGDGTEVTGMSVTMRNIVQFLPLLSDGLPTCQYLGSYNTSIQINLNSTDIKKVAKIREMLTVVARIARTNNRLGRYNMFYVSNPLVSLCGMKYFILENFSVDTVQGHPGLYSISLLASEFKLGLEKAEQLDRVGMDTNERVLYAAEYILDRARDYMLDGPDHKNTMQYKVYYDMLFTFSSIEECGNIAIDKSIHSEDYGWVLSGLAMTNPGIGIAVNKRSSFDIMNSSISNSVKRNVSRKDRGIFSDYYTDPSRMIAVSRISGNVDDQIEVDQTIFGTGNSNRVIPKMSKKDYMSNVYNTMAGKTARLPDGSDMNWDTEKKYLAYALAEEQMAGIKELLSEDRGLMDLKDNAFRAQSKVEGAAPHVVESSCYPDLDLPLYNDLPGEGDKFKLTYRDLGLLQDNPSMINKPAQSKWVSVDPDMFMSRVSIHKLVENTGNPGMEVGLRAFEDMAENCKASSENPIKASEFQKSIIKSTDSNDDLKNITIKNPLEEKNSEELTSGLMIIKSVIDGNTFDAVLLDLNNKETGDPVTIKILDYYPEIYSSRDPNNQPPMFIETSNNNTTIARNVLANQIIRVGTVGGETGMTDGKTWRGVYNVIVPGWSKNIKDVLASRGMTMRSDIENQAQDLANAANNSESSKDRARIHGELAVENKDNLKKIKINTAAASVATMGPKTSLKNNNKEVTDVSLDVSGGETAVSSRQLITAASVQANRTSNVTKNSTFDRFDRYSQRHIRGISERIKNQSKDDMLRMVRAFPTFKFYFVEEDRQEWKMWPIPGEFHNLDDMYSYNAIMSIDINKSRKEASDVAVVKILNTRGVLDREKFGLHDSVKDFLKTGPYESTDLKDKETFNEQEKIEEFILKVGTRIRIKMGYSSDATVLDNVFTGQVTEVVLGDVIQIVAQGYGTELTKTITGWGGKYKYQDHSAYKILDKIMMRPEITHFGYTEWSPIVNYAQKILYRRYQPNTGVYSDESYSLRHPSIWRNFGPVSFQLIHWHDPRNDNIFTPEVGKIAEWYNGDGWDWNTENRTVWDIFQEFTVRMPGYVTQVVPYDNRATIYFGPSDGYYSYSNEVRGILAESNAYMRSPKTVIEDSQRNGDIRKMTPEEMSDLFKRVDTLLNGTRLEDLNPPTPDNPYRGEGSIITQNSVDLPTDSALLNAEALYAYLGRTEDQKAIESVRKIIMHRGIDFKRNVNDRYKAPQDTAVSMFKSTDPADLQKITMFVGKDGKVYDEDTFILDRQQANLKVPANFKLFRAYHYYDSFRNIISNNIIASEDNMWNRVEISGAIKKTPKHGSEDNEELIHLPSAQNIVRAQVDDSIWKEGLITRVFSEPNAHTPLVSWLYAMGRLKQGVNEMYSGHLTVMGDPTVKPNDVVFINDYYTDMHGAFEVREVTHHFSHDTGFITTIIPDCICYANNSMAMASEAVAGGWYDDVARSMLWVYSVRNPASGLLAFAAGPGDELPLLAAGAVRGLNYAWAAGRPWFVRGAAMGVGMASSAKDVAVATYSGVTDLLFANKLLGVPLAIPYAGPALAVTAAVDVLMGKQLRNLMSSCQFAVAGWTQGRREPINFLPLLYANRPYIAGVRGMRRSDWWEPLREGWRRFTYYRTKAAPRYLSQSIDAVIGSKLSG